MPEQPYLEVKGLTKQFGSASQAVAALGDVSFTLAQGKFLAVLGPSGCGKSTLFNIIAGLMAPDAGDVALDGDSLLMRPGRTGYMLQKDLLLPWLSVADNITLPQTLRGVGRRKALADAMEDVRACGIEPLLNRRPDELSGGQRQRAALVRTLQSGKDLLLLDEPFGALDAITRLRLQQLLTSVCLHKSLTVLFVTHDVDEALLLCDELLVMGCQPGRIIGHYEIREAKPRTMKTLATPALMQVKSEVMTLLEQEVTQHAQE